MRFSFVLNFNHSYRHASLAVILTSINRHDMSNFQLQTTTAMRSYSIAFSNNVSYRIGRHVIFWLVWYLFFVITYSYQPGNKIIGYPLFLAYTAVKMLVYIPVHMLFCYIIIYLILPYYFLRNRYGSGICLLILSLFATVCVSYSLKSHIPALL